MLTILAVALAAFAVGGGGILANWLGINRATKNVDDGAEIKNGNLGLTFQFMGLIFVLGHGMSGMVPDLSKWWSIAWMGGGFITLVIVAFGTHYLTRRKLMGERKFTLNTMHKTPAAIGLTQLGVYIMIGLAMHGSFTGTAPTVWRNVVAIIELSIAALASIYLSFWLAGRISRVDLLSEVRMGNMNAGIVYLGIFGYLGITMMHTMGGDFQTLPEMIAGFIAGLIVGIGGGLVLSSLIDRVFIRDQTIHDAVMSEHGTTAAWFASVMVASAYVVAPTAGQLAQALAQAMFA